MRTTPQTVAVIGAGAAGLTAAHLLQRRFAVTLYEAEPRLGGHAHTVEVRDPDGRVTPVDTGFIVCNDRNYPLFTRLLDQLAVPTLPSDMSFSYWDEATGLQYNGGSLNGLFAQRRNLCRPAFWRMLREILRFFRLGRAALRDSATGDATLGGWLTQHGFDEAFVKAHILPMGAAIWSAPPGLMLLFPAQAFLRFFENHGLLDVRDRPRWRTVAGGSRSYVEAIRRGFQSEILTGTPVAGLRREVNGVSVLTKDGAPRRFDLAVVAAHADQALALLADPDVHEEAMLKAWAYSRNDTVLHRDPSLMPPLTRAWASWNYRHPRAAAPGVPVTVTYHMNRLQTLPPDRPLFVTLNRAEDIPADRVVGRWLYEHPAYTRAAFATHPALQAQTGARHTWFCGAYTGYGFHEDAVRSAARIAAHYEVPL